jgi:hypothetical protein
MEPWLGSTAEVFEVFVIHILSVSYHCTLYNAFFGDQAKKQLLQIFYGGNKMPLSISLKLLFFRQFLSVFHESF